MRWTHFYQRMISAIQFVGERSAGTDGPQDSRVPREVKRCRAQVEEYRDERDVVLLSC
jgi:hypothetical protein